jgi:hypothetical protein
MKISSSDSASTDSVFVRARSGRRGKSTHPPGKSEDPATHRRRSSHPQFRREEDPATHNFVGRTNRAAQRRSSHPQFRREEDPATHNFVGRTNRAAHPFSKPLGGLRPTVLRRSSSVRAHGSEKLNASPCGDGVGQRVVRARRPLSSSGTRIEINVDGSASSQCLTQRRLEPQPCPGTSAANGELRHRRASSIDPPPA